MTEFSNAIKASTYALRAQTERLRHISENISNADTPGYRRKLVSFESAREAESALALVQSGRVTFDQAELSSVHDPSHPLADADGYFQGSNVNLLVELADAREARRSYEANLKMFEQTRQMSSSLMELLRK